MLALGRQSRGDVPHTGTRLPRHNIVVSSGGYRFARPIFAGNEDYVHFRPIAPPSSVASHVRHTDAGSSASELSTLLP